MGRNRSGRGYPGGREGRYQGSILLVDGSSLIPPSISGRIRAAEIEPDVLPANGELGTKFAEGNGNRMDDDLRVALFEIVEIRAMKPKKIFSLLRTIWFGSMLLTLPVESAFADDFPGVDVVGWRVGVDPSDPFSVTPPTVPTPLVISTSAILTGQRHVPISILWSCEALDWPRMKLNFRISKSTFDPDDGTRIVVKWRFGRSQPVKENVVLDSQTPHSLVWEHEFSPSDVGAGFMLFGFSADQSEEVLRFNLNDSLISNLLRQCQDLTRSKKEAYLAQEASYLKKPAVRMRLQKLFGDTIEDLSGAGDPYGDGSSVELCNSHWLGGVRYECEGGNTFDVVQIYDNPDPAKKRYLVQKVGTSKRGWVRLESFQIMCNGSNQIDAILESGKDECLSIPQVRTLLKSR
jgi:hypothetical protein